MTWDDIRRIDDDAQNVSKFVFTRDDAVAEAVLYGYPTYDKRTVICCSTQSGCPIGCRFCGAGDHFARSLTADEIVSQPEHLLIRTGVDPNAIDRLQIMFMSMGEPLLNLKALILAMRRLHTLFPRAALLISTSAPKISASEFGELLVWSSKIPTIGLQFSVHESTDEARARLIPFKAKMTLEQIAQCGVAFLVAAGRKPFFNYCAHDENSSDADADRLFAKFDPSIFCATVSVVCERSNGMPATNAHQRELATSFASKLVERGYDTRVFDPAGQDTIGGGCGQLWFVQRWFEDNPKMVKPSIGFGREFVHAPKEPAPSSPSSPPAERQA